MQQVKRRTYSGCSLEVEVYRVSRQPRDLKSGRDPILRFKDEAERKAHRDNISRKKFVRLVNANFSPASFYLTLTFDDENECHDFREAKTLLRRYAWRLKRRCPEGKFVYVIGRGKNTNRIHAHMIADGFPEDFLIRQWTYGNVERCDHLREHCYYDDGQGRKVDHGRDYAALAVYLWEHWKPEQGGHRWKGTRNLAPPDREPMTRCKRNYSKEKPPRVPEGYMLVSVQETRYGYKCFRYVLKPERQEIGKKRKRI